jgi:DNA-binding MarR family transcriptional regulator
MQTEAPTSQAALLKRLRIDHATTPQIIDGLERPGLVECARDAKDGGH